MKANSALWLVTLVFAVLFGVALLGRGDVTGAAVNAVPITNGTILSVLAAVIAIGVLIVAGLQQAGK